MHVILAPGPLGALPWQFIIVASAQLEFEALAVLWLAEGQPGKWVDYGGNVTLGRAAAQLEQRKIFAAPSGVVETLKRIARLRNNELSLFDSSARCTIDYTTSARSGARRTARSAPFSSWCPYRG
jgi:hypothetical protein